MTLEDFFTLTEMKDGLTSPGRVEELVTVMQKEKDYVVKNVGEATRQWSTVASTIAATENKECLDLFIQLDGLWFFNRWLKDAQKFCNDTSDSFVEESINALLRALEKLHIDNERLFSSGIWITVKNLLSHNSSMVQDSTRALFDSWKWVKESDEVRHVDKVVAVGASCEDGTAAIVKLDRMSGLPAFSATDFKESADEVNLAEEVRDENLPRRSSDDLQIKETADLQSETSKSPANSLITLDHADTKNGTPEASAALLNLVQENLSIKEEVPIVPAEQIISNETCTSPDTGQGSNEGKSDVQRLDVGSDDGKPTNKIDSSPKGPVATEILPSSCTMEAEPVFSRADAANAGEYMNDLTSQTKICAKDGNFRVESASLGDVGIPLFEAKSGTDNIPIRCRGGGTEDPEINFSPTEDMNPVEEDEDLASDRDEDMAEASDILKLARDSKGADVIDKRSDIDIEYGFDALEVARQVAKAVEREVGEYGEPFCSSSSEKVSEGSTGQPGSPESINGEDNIYSKSPQNEILAGQNPSVESSPRTAPNSISSDNLDNEADNCIHNEPSEVTGAAQEPEGKAKKGMCDFDLNQEMCFEDVDRPLNPVSVVSASRAAAAPGLPAAPLQFEGTLGWKGSAATSAFRPASPRRITDGEKTTSTVSAKQRHDILDIDLNVAEGGDDKNGDLISGKHFPVSSGLPSGESSIEVSPRRSDRLKLDLNRTDDDDDAPASNWRTDKLISYDHNGHRSPSPASSSSPMQPFLRNIDLNDRPSIHYDSSDQQPYFRKPSSQYENAYGILKPVDPVISIMGTRVEVNRKNYVPQFMSLPNGKAPEAAMDVNLAKLGGFQAVGPTMSYAHSPAYGYNGLTTGASMPFYAPGSSIPYMVDSRGAPVVPQIMGYAPAVPSYSQQQFIASMTGVPPALNGAGPLETNFDLNSGFMSEVGNRDAGGSRQLFLHGQGRPMEELLRADLHLSSSGIGEKRKEPDGGWEPSSYNLKHHQPPWK